ncbi:MAG: tautomerase family protein [Alphaproteobacteria bacterium]
MPSTRIETRRGWVADPSALIDAVHDALVEALRIPVSDRTVRLIEHEPGHFRTPPHRGERYTVVEITMFSGRSMDAKRRLYEAIVRNLEVLGVPTTDVKIVLIDVPPENWGIRGGKPASEIELGFEIRV